MSRPLPKIEPDLSSKLPRAALLKLFGVETITGLEKILKLKDGTLSKAMPEYPTYAKTQPARGLSAQAHQTLLEGLSTRFATDDDMRIWMNQHWPAQLLHLTEAGLEMLYENLDLAELVPQVGTFPIDYIERNEKDEILNLLLTGKQAQVLWLTGPGGSGKSTLALSLVRRDWARLKKHYKNIFWVNVEQASYADGLRQIAESLDMAGQPVEIVEKKLDAMVRNNKVLFILDALHDVAELSKWRQLAAYLGKLVVTSRTRLSETELRADGLIHQVRLGGLSLKQGRQFLSSTGPDIDGIILYTEGLPLALRVLNGLMSDLGLSAGEVLTRLKRHTFDTLEYPPGLDRRDTNLRACFEITWQALLEHRPEAAQYFQAAGIFHTRIIFKNILEQAADIADPILGDRLAAILLRYNFINLLTLKGERFVQIHSLLHKYAQEKLPDSTNQRLLQSYQDAIYEMTLNMGNSLQLGTYPHPAKFHMQDILATNQILIEQADWSKVRLMTEKTINLLLNEGHGHDALELLTAVQNKLHGAKTTSIIWIHNVRGEIALSLPDIKMARENYRQAYLLSLPNRMTGDLDDLYQHCRATLGLARCMLYEGDPTGVQNLMSSPSAALSFSLISDPFTIIEKDILLGEMYDDLAKYDLALDCFMNARSSQLVKGNRLQKNRVRSLLANCYRNQRNFKRAIEIYTRLFAEDREPDYLRCENGLELAACLGANGGFTKSLTVLDAVEELICDYDGLETFHKLFARLWKHRATAIFLLGDLTAAGESAKKSLTYWRLIPDSAAEQSEVTELIQKIENRLA